VTRSERADEDRPGSIEVVDRYNAAPAVTAPVDTAVADNGGSCRSTGPSPVSGVWTCSSSGCAAGARGARASSSHAVMWAATVQRRTRGDFQQFDSRSRLRLDCIFRKDAGLN